MKRTNVTYPLRPISLHRTVLGAQVTISVQCASSSCWWFPALEAHQRARIDFHDPEGNAWLIQQVTQRLPGRVEGGITFASSNELAHALRRAAAAHGEHGKQTGQHDANWPDWYADYIVREQVG
jgi:hypothetical protein